MNVNIVLDSDYICSKLSEGKEEAIDVLFTYFKQKRESLVSFGPNNTLMNQLCCSLL